MEEEQGSPNLRLKQEQACQIKKILGGAVVPKPEVEARTGLPGVPKPEVESRTGLPDKIKTIHGGAGVSKPEAEA